MSKPRPTPSSGRKATFPVEPPPPGFEAKSPEERLAWLRRHGHPSDNGLNLRDYYNRGVSITQGLDLAVKLHVMVGPVVEKMNDAAIMRSFQAFILALDNGLVRLDKDISSHVNALYATGRLNDDSMVLTPVADPKIPDLCDDKPSLTSWAVIVGFLDTLIGTWPWLSKVRPGMNTSYSQLLRDASNAGQTFFTQFDREIQRLMAEESK